MFGAFPVGDRYFQVIATGLVNARLETIYHHPLRHAPEEGKGIAVQPQLGRYLLVENDILVLAPGESHDERPTFADCAHLRVHHPTRIT